MTNIELLKNRAKELLSTEVDFIDSIEVVLSSDKKFGLKDRQVLGMYEPLKKRITLFDVFAQGGNPEFVQDVIFPTYIHELVHALQHRECGTIGYLLMLGFCRWKLEKDAREIEDSMYNV